MQAPSDSAKLLAVPTATGIVALTHVRRRATATRDDAESSSPDKGGQQTVVASLPAWHEPLSLGAAQFAPLLLTLLPTAAVGVALPRGGRQRGRAAAAAECRRAQRRAGHGGVAALPL